MADDQIPGGPRGPRPPRPYPVNGRRPAAAGSLTDDRADAAAAKDGAEQIGRADSPAKADPSSGRADHESALRSATRLEQPTLAERPLLDPATVQIRRSIAEEQAPYRHPRTPASAPPLPAPGRAVRARQPVQPGPLVRVPSRPEPRGMDINDYLRLLRRGWPLVLAVTVLCTALAGVYVAVAPRSYDSSTALFVTANGPRTIGDLQGGTDFSSKAVASYADIVSSSTVLGPAAVELGTTVEDLQSRVSAAAPEETRIIDIAASAPDPQQAALIANAVAASATRVLPTLEGTPEGRPLVAVSQLRPAVPSDEPASPNTERVLAIGLVLGLCLGLGGTIARQSLDNRIRRADDVRSLTDVPTLAVLPASRPGRSLVLRDDPSGAAGEAYRTLRTNLRFVETTGRRSLLFVPVADDRDDAQVPANVAWSLAQTGRRVLLVDLDLRNSAVADASGVAAAGPGLAEVLTGKTDLASAVQDSEHRGVHVLVSGDCLGSPSDLLGGPLMPRLLRQMEREYDYVILHAPPLLASSDAAVVAGISSATFVTIGAGRTRAPELEAALDALGNVQVRPFGVVVLQSRWRPRPTGPEPRSMANAGRDGSFLAP